ncbi:cubilin homolog [Ctenocephalides felis]|uniref:cubilin homolog n=1 Tax=Ctenocephalides felis TaxID=7515 RepID=UPI000E6E5B75|nr:cubilin homolog [Ctenocephalides felis]
MNCYWNITAPPGKQVVVRIDHLEMEFNPSCYYDYLAIFDGIGEKGRKLAQLCGHLANDTLPVLKSSKNTMTIHMRTDHGVQLSGFIAHVLFVAGESQGCGGLLNITDTNQQFMLNPGTLMNSEGYLNNLDCHWSLNTTLGKNIKLEFQDFHLAPCVNHTNKDAEYKCNCDYLEVRDGSTGFAQLIGRYCGHMLPDIVISSTNALWIRFVSDGEHTSSGFNATIKSIPSLCGKNVLDVTKSRQILTAPGFPTKYPPSLRCTWLLTAPTGTRIDVHVATCDLQEPDADGVCSRDVLEISDKQHSQFISEGLGNDFVFGKAPKDNRPYAFGGMPITRHFLCGSSKPFDYYSGENEMVISFKSDSSIEKTGFKLEYSIATCTRNFSHTQGRIMYDNVKDDCTIVVSAPENNTLSLYFNALFMYSMDESCEDTYLEIYDGEVSTSLKVARLCGYETPDPIFSNSTQLILKSHTKMDYGSYNFDIIYTSTDQGRGCGGTLFNYAGLFSSPLYPQIYRKAGTCTWDVSVPNGLVVLLKFSIFDMGSSSTCANDFLEIVEKDPLSGTDKTVTRYCGGLVELSMFMINNESRKQWWTGLSWCDITPIHLDQPAVYTSSSNNLMVRYTTTINNGGTGWLANFVGTAGAKPYGW